MQLIIIVETNLNTVYRPINTKQIEPITHWLLHTILYRVTRAVIDRKVLGGD